ncbi:MAG: WYL domain-containing protein [Propionibacteriaceae bacterium]|nr:WYL domain-containing protein [Propionibacteriaceae bacterium]
MAGRKSERLINLVIALLASSRWLTRDEIRRSVVGYENLSDDAFFRIFERDKADLRSLGVPLETGSADPWADEDDAYRIRRDDFTSTALALTGPEKTLVALAATVWNEATLGAVTSVAAAKLDPAPLAPAPAAYALGATVPADDPALPVLWEGVFTNRPVRFTYHGRLRQVEPWRLILRRTVWYLVGRDIDAGPRLFRLSRITDRPHLKTRAPRFTPPAASIIDDCAAGLAEPAPTAHAQVAIRPGAAAALRHRGCVLAPTESSAPAGLEVPAGYDLVEIPYARVDDLVSEICAAGADALVLDPPRIRHLVLAHLRHTAGLAEAPRGGAADETTGPVSGGRP